MLYILDLIITRELNIRNTEKNIEIFQKHQHWPGVQAVTSRLQKAGFQAYLAGGCVRDLLLGRVPNDFDIATNAKPEQVEDLFARSIAVGKAFGVITVPFENYQVEISTFRKDGDYTDGRRPDSVEFCEAKEDARRRDFTINAMFYDPISHKVIDYVEGLVDIGRKIIRSVGDPELRFKEDQLRLLRAIRFSSQLGFKIELETWLALVKNPVRLQTVSRERCTNELIKVLQSSFVVSGLQMLRDSGLWSELTPMPQPRLSTNPRDHINHWLKSKKIIDRYVALNSFPTSSIKLNPVFSLSVLLMNLAPVKKNDFLGLKNDELVEALSSRLRQDIDRFSAELRLSRKMIQAIGQMILSSRALQLQRQIRFGCLAKAVVNEQLPLAMQYLKLRGTAVDNGITNQLQNFAGVLPPPWLSGKALIDMNFKKGPKMGALLQEGFYRQLEGIDKDFEDQLEWLKGLQKHGPL